MSCSEVWENLTFLGKRNKNTHKRNEEGAGPALTVEGRVWPLAATNSGQPHQANQAARLASIAILLICFSINEMFLFVLVFGQNLSIPLILF